MDEPLIEEAKKLSYQIDKKKIKNYGAFNDSIQQLESSKGATTI